MASIFSGLKQLSVKWFAVMIASGWTLLIAALFLKEISYIHREGMVMAHAQARLAFQKDSFQHLWASEHAQAPTIVPSSVSNTVKELGRLDYGLRGRLISLHPLNSTNFPDAWEAKALDILKKGQKQFAEVVQMEDGSYLRVMRPLFVRENCLECHQNGDYRVGDVGGGINISVPLHGGLLGAAKPPPLPVLMLSSLWIVGLGVVGSFTVLLKRRSEERQNAEQALRASAQRYHSLFNTIQEGFALHEIICDEQGKPKDYRYIDINPAFARSTGIPREHWIGHTVKEVLPDIDNSWIQIYGEVALSGRPNHFESYSDEVNRYFEIMAFCPQHGQFAVIVSDITERKRADEARRESEERFRVLVEQAPDAIIVYDDDLDQWVDANQNAERIFGCSREELLASGPFKFYPPSAADQLTVKQRVRDYHNRVLAGERVVFERLIHNAKGKDVVCEVHLIRLPSANRKLIRASYLDITERRKLEDQLRQAQKMDAIGQLAGGVAHDFNNILAAMLMQLNLLLDSPDNTPEMRAAIEDLESGANRAASLTRQLLAFSRQQIMQKSVMDMNEVLADLLKMLKRLLGAHIVLVYEQKTEPLWVWGDAGMIEQVVMNLCVNARDAMPNGGRLLIDTQAIEVAAGTENANPESRCGKYVCVSVKDTGIGMDRTTTLRIFEPFFTTKELGKGTGLGLATAYGIVKQHGGWIEVSSTLGVGSLFKIYFPAADEAPSAKRESVIDRAPHGNETILVVEDNESVRKLAVHCLKRLGYKVIQAPDGVEAVKCWNEQGNRIDLLLTDMVMPEGMTGLELAGHLRALNPALKVIISSGYSLEMTKLDGLSELSITYLPKPYQIETLARVVRECLDKRPRP